MKIKLFILMLFTVAILQGFMNGCSGQKNNESGEQFPRLYGPPHQRLKWKAENFFTDPGVLELCKAIEKKDLSEIGRLVKTGVNVNAKGRGNMTPLMWAFPMGEEVFKTVLENGADPNVQLTERLILGALEKDKSVMSASIELTDGLIHNQVFHDIPMDSYLRLVLSHGGNPNLENADGDNVLGYVPSVKLKPDKFKLLVDAGADVNHRNQRKETPVMSTFANFNYMLALLNVGADYRIIDDDGWDLILRLELDRMPLPPESGAPVISAHEAQPVFDWLTKEGVNWEAAKKALNTPEIRNNLKNIPADYQHRPWLPQRPTLRKTDDESKKS